MAEETARPNDFTRIKTDFMQVITKDPMTTIFYLFKFIEVILCCIAIGLADLSLSDTKIRRNLLFDIGDIEVAILFISIYGYILINVTLMISHGLGEQLPKKMLMIFSGEAAILCCIAGSRLIVELSRLTDDIIPEWNTSGLLSWGILAIVASLTFALDTLLIYKYNA